MQNYSIAGKFTKKIHNGKRLNTNKTLKETLNMNDLNNETPVFNYADEMSQAASNEQAQNGHAVHSKSKHAESSPEDKEEKKAINQLKTSLKENKNIKVMIQSNKHGVYYGAIDVNDNTGVDFKKYSDEHIRYILRFLDSKLDLPAINLLRPAGVMAHLTAKKVVVQLDGQVFDAASDDRFMHIGGDNGASRYVFNTYDKNVVPYKNTTVTVSENDALVGEVLYKATLKTVDSMAEQSVIDAEDTDKLRKQVLHTIASYIGYEPARMGYGLVIEGIQGSGKSLLVKMIGGATGYGMVTSVQKLTGKFAVDWVGKRILEVHEAKITSRESADDLKNMVTESRIEMENKGADIVQEIAHFNMIFTLNDLMAFQTFERENRRYFVLTADGATTEKDRMGHGWGTDVVMVTPAQYTALLACKSDGHLLNDNKDIKTRDHVTKFVTNDVSDTLIDGKHPVSIAQIGFLADNPLAFFGAYKHYGKLMGKHYIAGMSLSNEVERVTTKGDAQLSLNITTALGVDVEHNRVVDLYDGFLYEEEASNIDQNETYINLCSLIDPKRVWSPAVISYFREKFVIDGKYYRVIDHDKQALLVLGKYKDRNTVDGLAHTKQVKELYNSYKAANGGGDVQMSPMDALLSYVKANHEAGISYDDAIKLATVVSVMREKYGITKSGREYAAMFKDSEEFFTNRVGLIKYVPEEFEI